jgi:hypothetical protein
MISLRLQEVQHHHYQMVLIAAYESETELSQPTRGQRWCGYTMKGVSRGKLTVTASHDVTSTLVSYRLLFTGLLCMPTWITFTE